MAYTPKTIHSGEGSGAYSTKNAQDLAVVLTDMNTAIAAAGDITSSAAALTGTLTGTLDNALADISGSGADAGINKNFKELQDEVNKLTTAVAALIATLA